MSMQNGYLVYLGAYYLLWDYNWSHTTGLNLCYQFLPEEVYSSQYLTETLLFTLDANPIVVLFSESMRRADFFQNPKNESPADLEIVTKAVA